MCFQQIPVLLRRRRTWRPTRGRHVSHLRTLTQTTLSPASFSLALWNCQSAVNKADFIPAFATHSAVHLLALTETWIMPQNTATPAALATNFSFSHTPRSSGRGGGTGLLINDTWKFSSTAPLSNLSSLEYHAVRITAPIAVMVIVIYRPAGQLGNFCDELDMLLSHFPQDGTPLIVMGDLNIHPEKPQAADVFALVNTFDLNLVSTPPTHKAGNNLDLILTRNCTTDNILVTPLHVSDHFFIQLTVLIPRPSQSSPTLVTFRRNLRPARLSPSNPWLTDGIRDQRTTLRSAERKWRKSKTPSALAEYQNLLELFSHSVTRAKINYYQEKLSNTSDTRKLFSTFKSLIYPPSPPPSTSLTADNFANFFTNKVAAISSQFSPPDDDVRLTSSNTALLSSFAILTEDDVSTLLLSNHPTTCTLDPIPSTLLQAVAPALMPAITQVINTSLKTGTFPTSFKQALITPLLKKPSLDPSVVENYRPVSLLPFLAKTMERAVFKQLSDFLFKNNLLDVNQSGFKRGHSTETALLTVVEYLRAAKATGQSSVLILLDLSSAFDTVNHQILLSTLSDLGISGSALDWLCSYLSGQSFKVSWRGHLSNSHSLSIGVPQGSVLGPLLFSIYTSSLGAIIHSHGLSYDCYADDTQLFLSFPPDDSTVSSRISACLSDISAWMSERHLQLNLSKTEVLVFPARSLIQHNISINIGSTVIVPTNSAKNLGVIIDDQLSFKDHISSVSRACRFALYNIRKIRPYITEYTTQLIVQALVTSRLDYCNALLMGLPISTIKPLQMIQNAAAHLIFNQPKKTHVTPLFRSLHWLPVAARIRFKALSLAYRVVNSTAPAYLNSLIQVYNPSRPLRSANERRLVVPAPHRRYQAKLFSAMIQ
ncbi:hypothetical protein Q8A73_012533 [Channa argus]|nr:hypothetical protein Q8A73_012533 [Channa argus]